MSAVRTWEVKNRKKIVSFLKELGLKSGDILVRESYTDGPFGIPFSTIVSRLSKSEYSHAAMVIMKGDEIFVFEINDRGSLLYRMIDWLDFCQYEKFMVLRYKDLTPEIETKLHNKIEEYLELDEDYDFNYSDPSRLYCTESTMQVYKECGITIIEPSLLKNIIPGWRYTLFAFINRLVLMFTGKGFKLDVPCYFVGNKEHGILSSDLLITICPQNPYRE